MKLITRNENKPGYKETKIGWIPKEWDLQPLGKIGAFSKGKGITNSQKKKSGLPCITYGEIYTKHDFIIKEFKSFIDQETAESSQLILQNDILFAGSGETLDEIGKCVTNPFTNKVFAGGDIVILTPSGNDSLFLSLLINSNYITRFRRKLGQGHSVVHIYSSGLKTLDIPLPPLPEQKKIAAILSTWDKAISNYELLIKNYELRKKGLMQKLLSGEVRFPGFTEPWQEVSLGEVFNERREANLQHLPLLAITGSAGVVNRDDLDRRDTSNKDKSKYKRICPGDIGYNTMRMWQGVSALSDLEGIVSPAYTIVTPKKEINALFASYLFKHHPVIFLFYRYSQGLVSDTWNLKFRHFSEVRVKIPSSLNEQIKIASLFKNIDDEVSILKQKKNSIEQQKKGLMQKLLTGTVRVKPIKN